MSKSKSGFSEYELAAAEWRKSQIVQSGTDAALKNENKKSNDIQLSSRYEEKQNKKHHRKSRSRSRSRSRDKYSRSDWNFAETDLLNIKRRHEKESRAISKVKLDENGEVIGRDPIIRGRTRSRSLSSSSAEIYDRNSHRKVDSRRRSRSRDTRRPKTSRRSNSSDYGTRNIRSHWTHDKFSVDNSLR